MSNPFKQFETDGDLEKKGVKISYDGYWFLVARPGGKNEEFIRAIRERNARLDDGPGRASALLDQIKEEQNRKAFLEHCLLGWGSDKHGEGVMVGANDEAIEFSMKNADKLFTDLPELLADIITTAMKTAVWLKDLQTARGETDAKNSPKSSTGS